MRLDQRSETFTPGEDHTWLGSAHATDTWESITLDGDAFLATFTDGVVPSGVLIAKRTSDGLYVPYVGDSESASIAVDATGGTFTITVEGETTAAIAFNATAAAVQAAIEALPGIRPGDVSVTGGPGAAGGATPYVIAWVGDTYDGRDAPAVTTDAGSLTGGAGTAAVTTTAGGAEDPAGEGTAVGFLATTKDLGGTTAGTVGNTPAALMWHGQVIVANLPTGHGLDAAARRSLSHIHFVG